MNIPADKRNSALAVLDLVGDSHGDNHFVPALYGVDLGLIAAFSPFDEFIFELAIFSAILFVNLIKVIGSQ